MTTEFLGGPLIEQPQVRAELQPMVLGELFVIGENSQVFAHDARQQFVATRTELALPRGTSQLAGAYGDRGSIARHWHHLIRRQFALATTGDPDGVSRAVDVTGGDMDVPRSELTVTAVSRFTYYRFTGKSRFEGENLTVIELTGSSCVSTRGIEPRTG